MQIVATFNNYEEMQEFARKILDKAPEDPNKTTHIAEEIINRAEAKEAAEKAAKKEEAKKSSPKEEKPAEKPQASVRDISKVPAVNEEAPAKEEDAPEEKTVSESELKILLAKKLKAGKKADVMALWEEYGVKNLSELTQKHPDKIAEVYAKAEGI